MAANNMFMCISNEIIIEIYQSLDSAGDVKAMLSTCKQLHNVFAENSAIIAKTHVLRYVRGIDYKLPIMAVASRKVNPFKYDSTITFFREYIWQVDPWPMSCFTMEVAAGLPALMDACWTVVTADLSEAGDKGTAPDPWTAAPNSSATLTATVTAAAAGHFRHQLWFSATQAEYARALRTCLMVETWANLFHRKPGKDGALVWYAPREEWMNRYWLAFSNGEIAQLRQFVHRYAGCLAIAFQRYREECFTDPNDDGCPDSCNCFNDLDSIFTSNHSSMLFAQIVGVENLHSWMKWVPGHLTVPYPAPLHRKFREFQKHIAKHQHRDRGLMNNDGTYRLCPLVDEQVDFVAEKTLNPDGLRRPRFVPDPHSMNDTTWCWCLRGWQQYFGCRVASEEVGGILVNLRDKATLEKYGVELRKRYPPFQN